MNTDTNTTPAPKEEKILWENYTPEQRQAIEEIVAWQASVGMTNAQFVEGCGSMAEQSWYQLSTGRYGAKDCTKMVGVAKKHAIERQKTFSRAQAISSKPFPFIETDKYKEVTEAVESASASAESGDDDKIVWVLGNSGLGKTEIARQLVRNKAATLVTASEAWRDGFLDALTDIAAALGIAQPNNAAGQPKAWASKGTAETAILKSLRERPRVLCINEVEYFSRRLLNHLRKIVDETRTVIVIFCVPDFYKDILRQGGAHAHQLRTRTEGVVWLDKVERVDIAKALAFFWPHKELKDHAKLIAEYANVFGGWRVVKRLVRNLRGKFPLPGNPPGTDDVIAAINLQKDYQEA